MSQYILQNIEDKEYWKNQHALSVRKCMRLNDELKREKYLHNLTKSCRKINLTDILCDDMIQLIFEHLGIYANELIKVSSNLNKFKIKLKVVNITTMISPNIRHLIKQSDIYSCINRKFGITYTGECVAGLPHGKGKLIFTSVKLTKAEISGNFLKGLPHGNITLEEEETTVNIGSIVYFMTWSKINIKHGNIDYNVNCSIKSDYQRSYYEGEFEIENSFSNLNKSILSKTGKGFDKCGLDCYIGEWYKNKYHGIGEYMVNDVVKYSGYWSGGLPFCPEIGMYGDIHITLLQNKTVNINNISYNFYALIINDTKMIAYKKVLSTIKERIIVEKIGSLALIDSNWKWEI